MSAPAAKRSKYEVTTSKKQSSLTTFFGGKPKDAINKKEATSSIINDSVNHIDTKPSLPTTTNSWMDPIIPSPTPISTSWRIYLDCILLRSARKDSPRKKVAAFDLDGTLLVWRSPSWPSQLQHYELWNATVFSTLQQRYDEGYKLLLVSNQGAIRKAFTGKNATRVKTIIEWLINKVDRPVHVIMSTNKNAGYHKPSKDLWVVAQQELNGGMSFDIENSFYVGDSIEDNPDDPQGGVDSKFARNISEMTGTTLKFHTPDDYFGPSTASQRKISGDMETYESPTKAALVTRAALTGCYLNGPILLILCGVQGSGKSYFCQKLLKGAPTTWVHLSQDTINHGKPGKREQVESEASSALASGKSVVIDRMHLDEEQRCRFIQVAKQSKVAVHALLLQPPKAVVLQRVRTRTNHPAGVEGEKGVEIAASSLNKIVRPCYKEGLDLISVVASDSGVLHVLELYKRISDGGRPPQFPITFPLVADVVMPAVALGTMKIGKRIASNVISMAISAGVSAVDTAPTYNNEANISANLRTDTFVIIKVPKCAIQPDDVRQKLSDSLFNLQRDKADLLLLHWPSDVILADTLKSVWQEMEALVQEGRVRAIGVCNFNIDTLRQLLPICSIRPAVNQVERHPMLPQWDLFDFCFNHGILLQAHSPLGQGNSEFLGHDTFTEVAKTNNLSPAQVVLQWNLQHGVAVVPKCSTQAHLHELSMLLNGDSTLLPGTSMKLLDGIEQRRRFISPPFMYSTKAIYAWGEQMPSSK